MHATPFAKKYPENLTRKQGAAGPGPAGYAPDKFISTGLIFSPRATIGNAARKINECNLNPGVGLYNTHEALDRTKFCPARGTVGRANLGLKTQLQMTTSPSPTSYKPSLPYMKLDRPHQGTTIGNAVRMFETMKIASTPGPHDNQQRHSSLTTTGASGFNKKATFRGRNVLDPIYQRTSRNPSPQSYSCALNGPEIMQNISIRDQKVSSPLPLIGKCVLSNSKNITAIGFGSSNRFGRKKQQSPGPSDYDTDNESIGNRCRTAMGNEQSDASKIFERFRNATPEFDDQKRRRAAIFKIAPTKGDLKQSNRKPRNPSQLYDKKIYEVDQSNDHHGEATPMFKVDWGSIEDMKKNGSGDFQKRRFPAPVRLNTQGRNLDQKSCNELCNQIIEPNDLGDKKRRVNKLHSEFEVGTTLPTTTNASTVGENVDYSCAESLIKMSQNQKPNVGNKKRPVQKKKLTLPISFFQPKLVKSSMK